MTGKSDHRRNMRYFLLHFLHDAGAASMDEIAAAYRGTHREHLFRPLRNLEYSRLVEYDPERDVFQLTETGRSRIMRRRKKNEQEHQPSATPVNLERERERLILEMMGEHGLAIVACQDDPVLHERLNIAISDGIPPIDLSSTPKYRRPQVVEQALDEWSKITREGPCGWCGTRTARPSPAPLSYLDATPTSGFASTHGQKSCAWCAYILSTHTLEEFREMAFNAVAGVWGIPIVGQWRAHEKITPFAHEIGYTGVEWGHLQDTSRPYLRAMQIRAQQVVHRSRFITSEAERLKVSIPGVVPYVWTQEELPSSHPTRFAPIADMKRDQEEAAALQKRQAAHEAAQAVRYSAWNKRREEIAAEKQAQDQELQQWAQARGL